MALVALVVLTFGLFAIAASFVDVRALNGSGDPGAVPFLLGLWLVTGLAYPSLLRASAWCVDVVILRRADYNRLCTEIYERVAHHETAAEMLSEACAALGPALNARQVTWCTAGSHATTPFSSNSSDVETTIAIPTTDEPRYVLSIGELTQGRRLLSDDVAMLDTVALILARRIDAVRVAHERCQRAAREQELHTLAAEAQLRELRAQLDPHFLFNALNAVASLVETTPAKALEALLRLTSLLRSLLRRTAGEFVTLGDEIDLVAAYLAIEHARFEERLAVTIDVPSPLRQVRVPSFVLQPLVENAIKHGISRRRQGGEVNVRASADDGRLTIVVRDTGIGANADAIARGREDGVGLDNISRRLALHYGPASGLEIASVPGCGTTVEVHLPIDVLHADQVAQ